MDLNKIAKEYKELSDIEVGTPLSAGFLSAGLSKAYLNNKAKRLAGLASDLDDQIYMSKHFFKGENSPAMPGTSSIDTKRVEQRFLQKQRETVGSQLSKTKANSKFIPRALLGATAATWAGMGLYNAYQRSQAKAQEQRRKWYENRKAKMKTAAANKESLADRRNKAIAAYIPGLIATNYGANKLRDIHANKFLAKLREQTHNLNEFNEALSSLRKGKYKAPIYYAPGGSLAAQKATKGLKRNIAITAAGLGALTYGSYIDPSGSNYVKTSSEKRPKSLAQRASDVASWVMPNSPVEIGIPAAGASVAGLATYLNKKHLSPAKAFLNQERSNLRAEDLDVAMALGKGPKVYNEKLKAYNEKVKTFNNNVAKLRRLSKLNTAVGFTGAGIGIAGIPAYHMYKSITAPASKRKKD